VKLVYLRPGTPTDNAYIESFNGSFGNECLNMNWFMSNENAKDKVEACKNDYNEFRPHSALTYLTPVEFARKHDVFGRVSIKFFSFRLVQLLGDTHICILLTLKLDLK